MAKYDVTYSCGHSERVKLFGPTRDRERKIEWMESRLCYDCFRAKLERDRLAASAAAAQQAEENGLPPLIGSEKQVAWAETIRLRRLSELDDSVQKALVDASDDPHREALLDMIDRIHRIGSAKWWIDHREDAFHIITITQDLWAKSRPAGITLYAAIDAAFR